MRRRSSRQRAPHSRAAADESSAAAVKKRTQAVIEAIMASHFMTMSSQAIAQ